MLEGKLSSAGFAVPPRPPRLSLLVSLCSLPFFPCDSGGRRVGKSRELFVLFLDTGACGS